MSNIEACFSFLTSAFSILCSTFDISPRLRVSVVESHFRFHSDYNELMRHSLFIAAAFLAVLESVACAVEHITFKRDGETRYVSGRVLVSAQDGGRLLEAFDGAIWAIQPEEIASESEDNLPYRPLSKNKMAEQLLAELPNGFQVHATAHYVICYNTSKTYAMWCGGLFERLNRAFVNHWSRRGLELQEPEYPLPAIIFSDRAEYQRFARDELGDYSGSILGYYNLRSNRITMFDLTGTETLRGFGTQRTSMKDITRLLSRPEAEPLVATIVHEATHQIAFNSGLQTRYADNPMWLSEGLAIYFETPDVSSSRGWRGIGQVNRARLFEFRKNKANRSSNALPRLLTDDNRFRKSETALASYAEAWALTYFLIRSRPKQYCEYLGKISRKPRVIQDEPGQRLSEFKQCFGDDLAALDVEFLRYMGRVR